ncbi:MAG: PAS domain S-box protein, partial [Alphaproteobacteria bacterium]
MANADLLALEAIIRVLPVGVFVANRFGQTIKWNPAMERLYGRTEAEVLGRAPPIADGKSRRAFADVRDAVLAGGVASDFDIVGRHADGGEVRVRVSLSPCFDESDELTRIVGVVADTSEQASLEDRHRMILGNAMDGFMELDNEGRIVEVNDTYCDLIGYTAEELRRMRLGQVVSGEARDRMVDRLQRIRRKGRERFVSHHRCRDGGIVDLDVNVRHEDIDGGRYFAFFRDITEIKRAEKALRTTQFIVDQAGAAIFWIDRDASIRYVNETACKTLGYAREELLSMTAPDIDPNFPKEAWAAQWEKTRASGTHTFESLHQTKDGRTFPVEITAHHVEFGGTV